MIIILILLEPMCKMFNVLVKMSIRNHCLWLFAHKEKQINIRTLPLKPATLGLLI